MKVILILFSFFPMTSLLFAQSDADKIEARKLGMEAIQMMDKGEVENSLPLLAKAEKLDPGNVNYPYETAYAHYMLQDYKKANKLLIELVDHPDVSSAVFQLLGNSYDILEQREKAMETYKKGLELFPTAGNLYLEIGVVHMSNEEMNEALNSFERGIYFDPAFASNYYWAARFYLGSDEEVWGMLYGEIFINLERGSKRTSEISELLYNTYKREIQFDGDQASVSFSKNSTISVGENGEMKMPFALMVYEPTLMLSIIEEKEINLESLHRIRSKFVQSYFDGNQKDDYPNILFDYQKEMRDLGYFEAYNYWLLMKGDEAAFTSWQERNQVAFEEFITWYINNPLTLDQNRRFHSSFY